MQSTERIALVRDDVQGRLTPSRTRHSGGKGHTVSAPAPIRKGRYTTTSVVGRGLGVLTAVLVAVAVVTRTVAVKVAVVVPVTVGE